MQEKMVAVWCRAPFFLFSVVYTSGSTWRNIYEQREKNAKQSRLDFFHPRRKEIIF
jgi:hypothetical protein